MFSSNVFKQFTATTVLSMVVPVASLLVAFIAVRNVSDIMASGRDETSDHGQNSHASDGDESEVRTIDQQFHVHNALNDNDQVNRNGTTTRLAYSLNQFNQLGTAVGNTGESSTGRMEPGSSSQVHGEGRSGNGGEDFDNGNPSLGWKVTDKGRSSKALLDPEEEVKNFFPEPTIFNLENDASIRDVLQDRNSGQSNKGGQ